MLTKATHDHRSNQCTRGVFGFKKGATTRVAPFAGSGKGNSTANDISNFAHSEVEEAYK